MAGKKIPYVVSGATLKCNYGSCTSKLMLPTDHGVYMSGKPSAHDQDCIPFKNIMPFGKCCSGTYFASSKAIKSSEMPCVLDLLDKFYFPDEFQTVTNWQKIRGTTLRLSHEIQNILSTNLQQLSYIRSSSLLKYDPCIVENVSIINTQYSVIAKAMGNLTEIQNEIGKVEAATSQLVPTVKKSCSILGADQKVAKSLANISEEISKLEALIAQIKTMPAFEKNYLITMKSVLICRCGGKITAVESGQ